MTSQRKVAVLGGVLALLGAARMAIAADVGGGSPNKTPGAAFTYDWNGLYFGAQAGFSRGLSGANFGSATGVFGDNRFGGMIGGIQGGYNLLLPSNILIGLESDLSSPNTLESNSTISSLSNGPNVVTEKMDFLATARGRVGYVVSPWMIYGTVGFALVQRRFLDDASSGEERKVHRISPGGAIGGGAEYAFSRRWALRLEYLYDRFDTTGVTFGPAVHYSSKMDFQSWRLGLNSKVGWNDTESKAPDDSAGHSNWELHGQTTYIQQGYPSFHAPYSGANSLTPWPQTRETLTASAFLGLRAWEGGELYYTPELFQGFGLGGTVGLGGFSNGDAQKSAFSYPHYSTSRLLVRQTVSFGGQQEILESAPNQLSEKVDVSRLTVQAGLFPVADVFDGNAYARDSRSGFMNWAIWAAGAFDYAADRVGLGPSSTVRFLK
jgi:high affinity Mn2+ porin